MSTLFQIHANMNTLRSLIKELGTLWQPGDSILLLGETCAYYDWAKAYVDDFNSDDETDKEIEDIKAWYALSDDINALNDSAKLNLNFTNISVISDRDWVHLTQDFDRVVTLNSSS